MSSELARELAGNVATPAFAAAVVREAIPVVGVLALSWSAFAVALFFLVESWLALSLRAATEIAVNPRYAGKDLPRDARDAVAKSAKHFAYVGPLMLVFFVGPFAFFVLRVVFPDAAWDAFWSQEARAPSMIGGGVLLLAVLGWETLRFARTLMRRGHADPVEDLRTKLLFYRVPALVPAAFAIALLEHYALGPALLVVTIAALSLLLEAAPRGVIAWIEGRRADR